MRAGIWPSALLAGLAVASFSSAGDRKLNLLLVNMTPHALSDDASRACAAAIRRTLRTEYTTMSALGETALRAQVARVTGSEGTGSEGTGGEGTGGEGAATTTNADFMTWSAAQLESVREGHDSVFLVDCRPASRYADALVVSAARGSARLRLRRVAIDDSRAAWLARAMLNAGWTGFTP